MNNSGLYIGGKTNKMDLKTRLSVLDQIYKIYDRMVEDWDIACRQYCSECCTRNVIMTGLEGYKIMTYLISQGKSEEFKIIEAESDKQRFQPRITTNALAALCMKGEEPPEEENEASWGNCPFLQNNECPIYPARPFGCRCFVSKQKCAEIGFADMEPFMFAVNTVFLQYIEHIDSGGYSGNFTDVLRFMASEENRQSYSEGTLKHDCGNLIPNQPIRTLLIFPEHKKQIEPVLKQLAEIKIPGEFAGTHIGPR